MVDYYDYTVKFRSIEDEALKTAIITGLKNLADPLIKAGKISVVNREQAIIVTTSESPDQYSLEKVA